MSICNDHGRCLDLLRSDDEAKIKLVKDNLARCKMNFGKHKGRTFQEIFVSDSRYTWWVCNKADKKGSSFQLFKEYCQSLQGEKGIKPILQVYSKKEYKQPPAIRTCKSAMRTCEPIERFCRLCGDYVSAKETFHGEECSVCGFSF